jgi:hypothetical protein
MFKFLIGLWLIFPFIPALTQIHDAELVYERTDIAIRNGKLYENLTYEIKINNRAGEKYAKVSLPYSKLLQISKLEAWVKDKNGVIIKKLQKNDITDRSAFSSGSFYEDNFVKEFTLKHNSYPYSVCFTYQELQEEFLEIEDWVPVLDREIPTTKAEINLVVPKDYKIAFKSNGVESFIIDTLDEEIKFSWTTAYKEIVPRELFSPPLKCLLPRVQILPLIFKYDLPGSYESWLTYGNWQNELQKGLSGLPPEENGRILDLISGIKDTVMKIKKLYNYLQDNTRYINVLIETGGLKPYPASYVAKNKYGDCKALSFYFKSVLEYTGIQSFYVNVHAGDPIENVDKEFPAPQFNHIIVCVPVKNDTIWLDCTSDNPFNYLGTFTQNRDVLIIDKKSHLTRTPALTPGDVIEMRNVKIHRNIQNQAIADFNNTYKGDKYELLYYLNHSVNESDKSQYLRNKFIDAGFELIDFKVNNCNRDSSKIVISYSGRSNKIYNIYGKDLFIDVLPFSIPEIENPKKRTLPVQIDYPIYKTDSLEYELPIGYKVAGDPFNQTITNEFGRYMIRYTIKGNKVEIYKSFLLYRGNYSLDKYNDLYKFLSKISDIEKNNKILTNENI